MEKELTFGDFIKQRRESIGKSLRDFAVEIDIGSTYLFDIEKGNRPAPEKKLDTFIEALNITGDDLNTFYDLAGKTRNNHFHDIQDYIGKTDLARVALRTAKNKNLSDNRWREIISLMEKPPENE